MKLVRRGRKEQQLRQKKENKKEAAKDGGGGAAEGRHGSSERGGELGEGEATAHDTLTKAGWPGLAWASRFNAFGAGRTPEQLGQVQRTA